MPTTDENVGICRIPRQDGFVVKWERAKQPTMNAETKYLLAKARKQSPNAAITTLIDALEAWMEDASPVPVKLKAPAPAKVKSPKKVAALPNLGTDSTTLRCEIVPSEIQTIFNFHSTTTEPDPDRPKLEA